MRTSTATRLVRCLWVAIVLLWVSSLVMVLADQPSKAGVGVPVGLAAAIYAIVGGLVARRRPDNPIGWLFCVVGLSLVLWMAGMAYAQAGLDGAPGLSSLPGAAFGAWIGSLSALVVLPVALPTFLLYFPEGHLRSRRWRVAVDDSTCRHGFMTQAQAAGAGLLRAGNLDGAAERVRPVRPAA